MTADVVVLESHRELRPTRVGGDETVVADRVEAALRASSSDLLGYLLRRTDRDDAPDVLSEVFVTVWRRRDVVPEDPTRARMWLFGVARRTLANHRRSRSRASALTERLQTALTDALPALREAGFPGSESGERAREVRAAVQALPPRQRELVALVHWDGFSLTEAAEIAGIRASTARSHYARARERLAELLAAS
ncbi:RNA polymerase sigma-70 factor (ECF subfamily) [Salana multivorans]|uniref:RNA polymerase sigma-70 factor (ECF subfamily) n=1 Tax=Salana multivorans TaxID=120377 RepID=A0A3N2D8D3_9MICO|nr:RNA polymerase sigma factor [Salana multivorans]ROR95962.1 RNA polymerase sigma-70 factor (ECF subfamily) [Salana multivorans]